MMKSLMQMDNLSKAELLCRLFPEELENLHNAIKKQCDYFLQNETAFREGWQQKGFFTAEFWYTLVQSAYNPIEKQKEICKRSRWFVDQFFDGYNSIFTIYCLIEYADAIECNAGLRQAIHLLFGNEKLLSITLNEN